MSLLLAKRLWTTKPPRGTTINWSNPLSQGLVFDSPVNEQGGVTRDLVNRVIGSKYVTAGDVLWTPDGVCSTTTTNTSLNHTPTGKQIEVHRLEQFSFATTIIHNPSSAGYYPLFFGNMQPLSSSFEGFAIYKYYSASLTTNMRIEVRAGSTTRTTGTFAIAYDNKPHTLVVVNNGTTFTAYIDGRAFAVSSNTALTFGAYTRGSISFIGNPGAGSIHQPMGCIMNGRIWDRALSATEASSISSNPWQIYSPQIIPIAKAIAQGMTRAQILTGISRGRISCGY